jgi:membrane protease subunit (stomatin/prohibitin family)
MAIIDVVKCDRPDLLVWKWQPPNGGKRGEELRLGTQLVVNQSQQAIFLKNGQVADIFEAGHYTLSTQNLPILSSIIGIPFGFQTPFKAEVFFINKTIAMETKFVLIPFNMMEPNFHVPIPITARGSFAIKIVDAKIFINKITGVIKDFKAENLKNYFGGVIIENVKNAITKIAREQKISPLELETIIMDVFEATRGIISETFARYGILLELFNIESIPILDVNDRVKKILDDYQRLMTEDLEERMRLKRRAENLDVYRIDRTFDTTEKAAENFGDGNSILGTIVGLSMIQPLGNTMGNMMNTIVPNIHSSTNINKDEIINLLKGLGELKEAGILTEEEFLKKKKELLSKI